MDLKRHTAALRAFCLAHQVEKLSLFGSRLHGAPRPTSDLDILIEFLPGVIVGYLDLAEMEVELSTLLGARVDLRTPQELSPHFRQQVMLSAQPLCVS